MKNFQITIFAALILLIGCSDNNSKGPERVTLGYELISDSIYARMLTQLVKCGAYAVWMDPFAAENYLHVVNTKDKTETATGTIGQGPDEFTTPCITQAADGKILMYDLNSARQALFTIGSEIKKTQLKPEDLKMITRKMLLGHSRVLSLCPNEEKPFVVKIADQEVSFGKFPLDLPQKIINAYDCFQGDVVFSPKRKLLIFSSMEFKYMAFYAMDKRGEFSLEKEVKGEINYEIVDNELKLSKKNLRGGMELIGTKDYLVKIERDVEYDKTESKGMDFTTLPKTLFVYNYDGELLKIVDIGINLLRLGGEEEDNVIYAIGVNPEFCLIKIDLGKL